ncbi:MAG: ATP-dependent DNA helicase [Rubrobacter sp.]|nr:ATP-dependent DNA helicase [Rubrobacter sp.]
MKGVEAAVETLFAEGGALSSGKSGYSRRSQQVELARSVARTISDKAILLADAPTGTGKSLAYLAPAALSGEKIVVSTATIALQHQLLNEDIPPLRKAVRKQLGYPEDEGFSYAVMKGRRNFLCTQRYHETLRMGSIFDTGAIRDLDRWASETETGDREDLDFPLPAQTWSEVASDGEDCAPAACPFREGCFYYAHRDKAMEADVIVVNHALLLANAASGGAIFDVSDRHLIVDEAHRLEDVMSQAFGARASFGRVRYAMRQAKKKSEGAAEAADGATMAAELFFGDLDQKSGRLGEESAAPRGYRNLLEALASVKASLKSDPKEEANNLAFMVGRLGSNLESFYREPEETHAYSIIAGRSRVANRNPHPELRSWLVDTDVAFREVVLPTFENRGLVLTSATLANGGKPDSDGGDGSAFSYARSRLGLGRRDAVAFPSLSKNGRAKTVSKKVDESLGEETFDYAGRCLLYVEDEIPEPARGGYERFTEECIRRCRELVSASGGRALILLSTNRALRAFKENFDVPYPVKFQNDDSPGRLVSWLKNSGDGILVGTRTFWEGIDVPGEAVSLVVIDRVPFPPPDDPVVEKLCQKAGKGWFSEVSLPRGQIALRQGAGRLMRRSDDRGVIALLDSRVNRKGWGKLVIRSFPYAPVTTSLSDVETFFGEGSGGSRSSGVAK